MKEIKSRIFPFIIALSALSVSASAAFYSVTGLSKLFAGASTQVMIMAGSLEVAKLVIASLLYQYWDSINKMLRTYLSIATIILILITSMGIYGYLSAAYQVTVDEAKTADSRVKLLETKKLNFIQQRDLYNNEKNNLTQGITQMQIGLANNKTSYIDKKGNLIQSTNSLNTKLFDKQLDKSNIRQSEISNKLDIINDSIFKIDTKIVETKASNSKAGELGPLIYLSKLSGTSMDKIINILLLVIIFVFDPLAIALVIAANFAFAQLNVKEEHIEIFKTDPEENLAPQSEFDILDLNKDGIISQNEVQQAQARIADIENELANNSFSEWRSGKLRREMEELKNSISKNDNIIDYN